MNHFDNKNQINQIFTGIRHTKYFLVSFSFLFRNMKNCKEKKNIYYYKPVDFAKSFQNNFKRLIKNRKVKKKKNEERFKVMRNKLLPL